MSGKDVLVTGSSGFLGRHVSRRFRHQGWSVRGFDLAETKDPGIETIRGDLTDPDSVSRAMEDINVVAHIGAIGDVYLAAQDPRLAADVNVVGTTNVIDSAIEHGARVVYASTWEVYGEPIREPIDEDHPTRPDHPYSITKLGGESLMLSACHLRGLSGVSLRLGTAYGSGLRPNSVFRIFIDRARKGEPITIQGDGSQGRQFTHATDIARAFELAAGSELSGMALNIVARDTVTVKELAERVVERFPTGIVHGPERAGDVPPALVSNERAREQLDWEPQVDFDTGIDELIRSVVGGES